MTSTEPSPLGATAARFRSLASLTGTAPAFDPRDVPDDPVTLFHVWLDEAVRAGIAEPHAATLATVDADGMPDARTLILKDVGSEGWAVAGPRRSRTARQLAARPAAALNVWWQPLVRAVRVRGAVVEAAPERIAADLAARPAHSGMSVEDWMVRWIRPERVEFWQGSPTREHLRLVYERGADGWTHRVLDAASDEREDTA